MFIHCFSLQRISYWRRKYSKLWFYTLFFFTENEVLETPIFKTMEPGEPVHNNKKLRWDHKVRQQENIEDYYAPATVYG